MNTSLDGIGSTTRNRILDGALACAEVNGVRKTTMDDIARRSEVARATVYTYFSSKKAVISAVVFRELGRFLSHLEESIGEKDGIQAKLETGFIEAYTFLRDHRLANRLLEAEPEWLLPFLTQEAPGLQTAYIWADEQIERSAPGEFSPKARRAFAEMMVRVMHSLLLSPRSVISLDTPEQMRAFVSNWLTPWLATATRLS